MKGSEGPDPRSSGSSTIWQQGLAHLTFLPSSQEARLYHNQTAELRELLEFAHMYLQSDDEVSGPLSSWLGWRWTPLDPLPGAAVPNLSLSSWQSAIVKQRDFTCPLFAPALSPLRVLTPPFSTCLNLASPGPSSGGASSRSPCCTSWLCLLGLPCLL